VLILSDPEKRDAGALPRCSDPLQSKDRAGAVKVSDGKRLKPLTMSRLYSERTDDVSAAGANVHCEARNTHRV